MARRTKAQNRARGRKARGKGYRGEHAVLALIEPWWHAFEPLVKFARTPKSGGWGSATEFRARGDIMTTSERWPFSVECKWQEGWSLDWLLEGKSSPVWSWWEQTQADAEALRAEPLLFFKRNHHPWRCLLRQAYVDSLSRVARPDHRWPTRLYCGHQPVLFLAERLLLHPPARFALRAAA